MEKDKGFSNRTFNTDYRVLMEKVYVCQNLFKLFMLSLNYGNKRKTVDTLL